MGVSVGVCDGVGVFVGVLDEVGVPDGVGVDVCADEVDVGVSVGVLIGVVLLLTVKLYSLLTQKYGSSAV